jgi:hypothetical protein
MTLQSLMHVQTSGSGVISRRTFIRNVAIGAGGLGLLGWKDALTLHAAQMRQQGMACILLFMRGGPSQFETFDPKPGAKNGGPTKAIQTAVNSIQIAESWTNVAKVMKDMALIRSMTSREGEHQRAIYQLHTGYIPTANVKYPNFGSIVAKELGRRDFDLPNFISIGNRFTTIGSGFLGMNFAPFVVPNANQLPNNVRLPGGVTTKRFERRVDLLKDLEEDFAGSGGKQRVQEHRAIYANASQMVLSPRLKAFDLNQEKDSVRDRYGRNPFGQACLLARRLVEQGVTFVEVDNNETVDPALAALVSELKERGRLEKTLVIWMGEFGRTPRINPRSGRDHFPRAFSVALAGGGIKGGLVIGKTNDEGNSVAERPVTVADLFCTFCQALKINPRKENHATLGRPIKIVDGGKAVKELFA